MARRAPSARKVFQEITGNRWRDDPAKRIAFYGCAFAATSPSKEIDYKFLDRARIVLEAESDFQVRDSIFSRVQHVLGIKPLTAQGEGALLDKIFELACSRGLIEYRPQLLDLGLRLMAAGRETIHGEFFDLAVEHYSAAIIRDRNYVGLAPQLELIMRVAQKYPDHLATHDYERLCINIGKLPVPAPYYGKNGEPLQQAAQQRQKREAQRSAVFRLQFLANDAIDTVKTMHKNRKPRQPLLPSPPTFPLLKGPEQG